MRPIITILATGILSCLFPLHADDHSANLREETFQKVWSKIDETLYKKLAKDIDWNEIKSKYEDKAKKAQSDKELRVVLNEMLGELKLSHFGVSSFHSSPAEGQSKSGHLGIELRYINGQLMIFEVEKGSASEKAGLKPGTIVLEYEGIPVKELIEKHDITPDSSRLTRMLGIRAILSEFSSPPDGKTTFRAEGHEAAFDFEPGTYQGETTTLFGKKKVPVSFKTRLAGENKDVRVIAFNLFVPTIMPRIIEAVKKAKEEEAKGLIIDLRGNPGGLGMMATGLIGRLIEDELDLGDMNNASGNFPFHAFPQPNAYLGPIAVLVDSFSASTSEIASAALQEHERARIFGRQTTGAVLPSVMEILPNGDQFQYALGDFLTAVGQVHLEGVGVKPDELIPLNSQAMLSGKDPDLDAALTWLKKQIKK